MTAAGTGLLLRSALQRDRRRVLVWVYALTLVTVYAVVALHLLYPTAADRAGRAAAVRTPAGVLLSGPGYGIGGDYSLGAMLANELLLSVLVAVALMAVLLVVRHTRGAEEDGTADLVRAGSVGRQAPLLAGLLVGVVASAGVAAGVTAGLVGAGIVLGGLPVADSAAVGVGVLLVGVVFSCLAAVTAQVWTTTRAASGAAGAVVALAVLLRGIGDRTQGGSALSWTSPFGWVQQTRAYVDLRWTPLLLLVALAAALLAVAVRAGAHRDVGAGRVAVRPGPAHAPGWLAGPAALALRVQRGVLVGWAVALLLVGAVFGSFSGTVDELFAGNAQLAEVLGTAGSLQQGFTAATGRYLGLAVAAFAVGSLLRVREEESAGRTAVLLAGPVGRVRLLLSWVAVTTAAVVVLTLLAGLGAGVAGTVVGGGSVTGSLGAAAVQLPALLVTIGVAAVLVGVVPRAAALAWVLVVWQLVAGLFGPLLSLPTWALRLAPVGWVPQVPVEPVAVAPLVGLLAVGAGLVAVALTGHRRRDLLTG